MHRPLNVRDFVVMFIYSTFIHFFFFFYSICLSSTCSSQPSLGQQWQDLTKIIARLKWHTSFDLCFIIFSFFVWQTANACCLHHSFPLWLMQNGSFHMSLYQDVTGTGEINSIQVFTSQAINVSVLHRTAGTQYFNVVLVSHFSIPVCVNVEEQPSQLSSVNRVCMYSPLL